MKQLGFFILFSVVFHFLVGTTTLYFAERFHQDSGPEKLTQIEILEPQNDDLNARLEKTRQLIKQLKATVQEIKDPNKTARFESERNQRFEKETKAANLGLSHNSTPNMQPHKPEKISDEGDTPEFMKTKNFLHQQPNNPSPSAISTILPNDIQNSNATNLNADANVHYSFYSRVEDLFYIRWVERVRTHWDRISFDYKKNVLSGKTWSTTVEIWLNANGEFHSAYILKPSGQKFFDEAPVFAFKDARYFPNPPKAKVEPDGFVRLKYRFNVNVADY